MTAPRARTATVPKASCGPLDRPETGLQGQTPLADRQSGATTQAYNCNLEKVGQFEGEGASWQLTWFGDCAYYDTANNNSPGPQHPGTVVVDVSDPEHPKATDYLTGAAMMDPWESLKVNPQRKLLGANKGPGISLTSGGFALNPNDKNFTFYDISADCKHPKLLSDVPVDGHIGHTGDFSADGKTYYGTTTLAAGLTAMDISDPTKPKEILHDVQFTLHDVVSNSDGTRLYGALFAPANGLIIIDTSDIQKRLQNPAVREVSRLTWTDGRAAQMPTPMTIKGKQYILFTDESSGRATSCAQGLTPYGLARIIDISDEKNPQVVSKLMLETHDPANCTATLADVAAIPGFAYDAHYCSVDNPADARLAACSHFQSGMRVFDIGDPANPKEIAYYKPPARRMEYRPASSMYFLTGGQNTYDHTADWSSANSRFVWHGNELHLWMTSQDNGFQVLRFTNGVGLNTTLPKPSSGGCTTSGASLGILAALGLLPLLRRRRSRSVEAKADAGGG
ncbi:MAG TPA: hypothetical protein VFA79_22180 [Myxococcales bacterium]|nr:hypothetical protein [Myxococcales bacterium]